MPPNFPLPDKENRPCGRPVRNCGHKCTKRRGHPGPCESDSCFVIEKYNWKLKRRICVNCYDTDETTDDEVGLPRPPSREWNRSFSQRPFQINRHKTRHSAPARPARSFGYLDSIARERNAPGWPEVRNDLQSPFGSSEAFYRKFGILTPQPRMNAEARRAAAEERRAKRIQDRLNIPKEPMKMTPRRPRHSRPPFYDPKTGDWDEGYDYSYSSSSEDTPLMPMRNRQHKPRPRPRFLLGRARPFKSVKGVPRNTPVGSDNTEVPWERHGFLALEDIMEAEGGAIEEAERELREALTLAMSAPGSAFSTPIWNTKDRPHSTPVVDSDDEDIPWERHGFVALEDILEAEQDRKEIEEAERELLEVLMVAMSAPGSVFGTLEYPVRRAQGFRPITSTNAQSPTLVMDVPEHIPVEAPPPAANVLELWEGVEQWPGIEVLQPVRRVPEWMNQATSSDTDEPTLPIQTVTESEREASSDARPPEPEPALPNQVEVTPDAGPADPELHPLLRFPLSKRMAANFFYKK